MLTFAAIVPHTLKLLQEPKKAKKTIDALGQLAQLCAAANVEALIVLSPHAAILEKSFAVNFAQEYETDLLDLGIKLPHRLYKGDSLHTIEIRKQRLTDNDAPVTLLNVKKLDYGAAIPLSFLVKKDGMVIIPVSPSGHSLPLHAAFGETLKEVIMGSTKRFGVIASAALAHDRKDTQFDAGIIAALASDETAKGLCAVTNEEIKKYEACGIQPMVMLMGVLQGLPWSYHQLSYENVFDTGLLVAEFTLTS